METCLLFYLYLIKLLSCHRNNFLKTHVNACKTIRCLCRKSTVKAFIRCRIIAFGSGTNVQLNHFIKNKIEFIRVLSQSNMSRYRSESDTDTKLDANWDANLNWIQIRYKLAFKFDTNRIHIGYISNLNASLVAV